VYPKVSGLATWSENCKLHNSLPLGAALSPVNFAAITLCVASPTSNIKGKHILRYKLCPETFGYTLVCSPRIKGNFCRGL